MVLQSAPAEPGQVVHTEAALKLQRDLVQVQPRSFGDEADHELDVRGRHLAAAREPGKYVFHGEEDLEVLDDLIHRLDVHAPRTAGSR